MATNEVVFLNDILLPRNPTSNLHAATKGYVDTAVSTKAASSHTHANTDITGLGTASTYNVGTQRGDIPVLAVNGKLSSAVLPSLAITDVLVCEDEEEMLTSAAQKGDVAIRTDEHKTYILASDNPETLSNWKEIVTPTGVSSVNGSTGTVTVNEVPNGQSAGQHLVGTANGYAWTTTSYAGTITGDGSAVSFQVTHNLGSQDVFVHVIYTTGNAYTQVIVNAVRTSTNVVTLNFAVAPELTDTFRVLIHK